MIVTFVTLLACQLAGETAARASGLPVPGPVLGMVLLVVLLALLPQLHAAIRSTVGVLLGHLSLLFVPAGTGVVAHLDRLGPDGPALLAALVGSTLVGLAVTVLGFAGMVRLLGRGG